MNRFAQRLVCLLLTTLSTPAWAQSASLEERFGPSRNVRQEAAGGAYFSPRDPSGRGSSGTGYRIAELDVEQIASALAELRALGATEGELSLAGLPMWSEWSRDFVSEIQATLAEAGQGPASVRVIPHYRPAGQGLRGAIERVRAFFPMRQDFERPSAEEVRVGLPSVLVSEATTLLYATAHFPPEVAAPMLAGHFGLLTAVTAFRRSLSNWMQRSQSARENFLKQGAVSLGFVINYNVVARWPEIASDFQRAGPLEYLTTNLPNGLGHFAVTQGPTTLAQTLFFTVTFGQGVFRWEAMMSQDPERADQARRTAAVLTPAIFWVSGPALTWASTSQNAIAQIGPLALNGGHVALAALTVAGGAIAARPEILNPMVAVVDAAVYRPLAWLKERVRRLGRAIRRGRDEGEWTCDGFFARAP